MGERQYRYFSKRRKVDKLPSDAQTVKEYADSFLISTSLVYHQVTRGKADYEIVRFKGINFVTKEFLK